MPAASTCAPWADTGDVCAPCNTYDFDELILADGLQMATDILNNLTGWKWPGECEDIVRPCGPREPGWCGCRSNRECGCHRLSEIELPGRPVIEVTEVLIDGDIVDPARYRVDDHRWLVYLPEDDGDERQGWPCCQRIDFESTELDTWEVTYTYGAVPPLGGVKAAATLGCQLALACSTDPDLVGECQLPERVTSVVRQGISLAVLDPLDLFDRGKTGIASVDLWVSSVMYGIRHRPATVVVPGYGPAVTRPGL
jgi:hypothetical protein